MEIIRAKDIPKQQLTTFLGNHPHIDKELIIHEGYVVKLNTQIVGCFVLQQLQGGICWLRQLFVIKKIAKQLPILIEWITIYAKESGYVKVIVKSHNENTNFLLNALQFYEDKIDGDPHSNWWAYDLNP